MLSLRKFFSARRLLPYKAECERIFLPRVSTSGWRDHCWVYLKLFYFLSHILRMSLSYAEWTGHVHLDMTHFNPAYRIVRQSNLFQARLMLLIISFVMFGLYLHYFLYYAFGTSKSVVLECNQQLNFHNPKAMLQDNPHLFAGLHQVSRRNAVHLVKVLWKLVRKDDQTLGTVRFRQPLSMFPVLSRRNRVNEFLLYLGSEWLILYLMFVYPLLAVLLLYLFSPILVAFTGSWFDWLVLVETGCGLYVGSREIFLASTTIMCMVLVATSAISFYFGQLNTLVRELVSKTRGGQRIRPAVLNYQLAGFYREHQRMCRLVNSLSDHWQDMLCLGIVTNIPLNINCFCEIFLARQLDATRVFFLNLFISQFVIGFLAVYPSAYNATAAHRAGKYMVPLQPKITNLRLKLKWEHYHEIVHNSHLTIAFKASLFGRLTVFLFFKFVFFYIEAVIFVYNKH